MLSPSERISAEKEREEIATDLKRIRDQAFEDAFGPKYTEPERSRRKTLRDRDKQLAQALKVQL